MVPLKGMQKKRKESEENHKLCVIPNLTFPTLNPMYIHSKLKLTFQLRRPKQVPLQTVQILTHNEPFHLDLHCLPIWSCFAYTLFAMKGMPKFEDGRVHFRKS